MLRKAQRLFKHNVKLIACACAMCQMLRCGRDTKQWRVGLHLECLAIRHELQDAQPAITAIAFPATAEHLHVEHHLMHRFPRTVLIGSKGHRILEIARHTRMATYHQPDIAGGLH